MWLLADFAKKSLKQKKQIKVGNVLHEYKAGGLHSGGTGRVVKNHKQAVAIALSEASKVGK